jgi:hypothetical protein
MKLIFSVLAFVIISSLVACDDRVWTLDRSKKKLLFFVTPMFSHVKICTKAAVEAKQHGYNVSIILPSGSEEAAIASREGVNVVYLPGLT